MNNNIQKYMYWLLLVFLAVGFFYPPIGLIAIICMVAPVSVAFYKGASGVVIFVHEEVSMIMY